MRLPYLLAALIYFALIASSEASPTLGTCAQAMKLDWDASHEQKMVRLMLKTQKASDAKDDSFYLLTPKHIFLFICTEPPSGQTDPDDSTSITSRQSMLSTGQTGFDEPFVGACTWSVDMQPYRIHDMIPLDMQKTVQEKHLQAKAFSIETSEKVKALMANALSHFILQVYGSNKGQIWMSDKVYAECHPLSELGSISWQSLLKPLPAQQRSGVPVRQ